MEGLGRWKRDAPPAHYVLKIESFSTLSASSLVRYESPAFEAADAKWKLAIYPNGNKARGGQDHISLYLLLAEESCLNLKKEIWVTFRFFAFDYIRDKYLTVEGETRFSSTKSEYGFDKFLPLGDFKDAANGYLINDTCLFGAEVFLVQHTNKLNCLSMVAIKSEPFIYTWKIDQFSNMEDKEYYSEKFTVGGYDWKLQLYPKGDQEGKGTSLSLYLLFVYSNTGTMSKKEKQVTVDLKMRVLDQLNKNHTAGRDTASFATGWGWPEFLSLTKLMDESNGYLVNDSLIVQAEVIVLGSTTNC